MVEKYPKNGREKLLPLFDGHQYLEAVVKGTLLDGLGEVFVDDLQNPAVALLSNIFLQALGGDSTNSNALDILKKIPSRAVIFYPNKEWLPLINEHFKGKLQFQSRTKMSSESLSLNHIKELKKNLPAGFKIVKITEEITREFDEDSTDRYSRFYGSIENFLQKGFGFCALSEENEIACIVATGCPMFNNAFEIEVDTNTKFRRRGLATVTCAYLIEYSLENGYDPRWDAANEISVHLALKLGYSNPEKYQAHILWEG